MPLQIIKAKMGVWTSDFSSYETKHYYESNYGAKYDSKNKPKFETSKYDTKYVEDLPSLPSILPSVMHSPRSVSEFSIMSVPEDELLLPPPPPACPASPRSPSVSSPPRSIFGSYWSSPNARKGGYLHNDDRSNQNEGVDCVDVEPVKSGENIEVVGEQDEEKKAEMAEESSDDLLHRLQHLTLPLIGVPLPPSPTSPTVGRASSPTASPSPTSPSFSRRQILPSPPPPPPPPLPLLPASPTTPTAAKTLKSSASFSPLSASLTCPSPPTLLVHNREALKKLERPWSSTSALIPKPARSCLRKARYSISGKMDGIDNIIIADGSESEHSIILPSHLANRDSSSPSKESRVSFDSHVSVFEFIAPEQQERLRKKQMEELRWASLSNYFL